MPQSIPVKQAKAHLSEVLNRARWRGEQFLVTHREAPWAVIIGIDTFEDLLDQLDTMTEQVSPNFQKSLEKSMEEYRKGEVGTIDVILHRVRHRKEIYRS